MKLPLLNATDAGNLLVEEALIEMYLAGVSVRRVEDITEALWGTKVSPGTISNLNKKAYEHIETWRTRPLVGGYPYVYVDGVYLKRSWGGCWRRSKRFYPCCYWSQQRWLL